LLLETTLILASVYNMLASDFCKPSEDDLKEFSIVGPGFWGKPFYTAFKRLSEVMATRAAHVPGTEDHARNPSPESDLSSSSQEDKEEGPSRAVLASVLDEITGFEYHPIRSTGYIIAQYAS
jgi:hypothetical protein